MSDVIHLLAEIVGQANVLTDQADRKPYETDVTGAFAGRAMAVVRPANTAEVSAIVKLANRVGIPIVPQGGNTGLTGACYTGTEGNHLVVSLSRMNAVREIRPDSRIAIVEAGVVLENLHKATEEHGLIYPMTFGAKGSCMIGGNIGTNAGGSNVVRYGNTRDLVLGVEVVLPNGEIADLMSELHKDNTGYNLKHLFIGAEGTLGIVTAAVLKLKPKPTAYFTAMVSVLEISASLVLLNRLQQASGNGVEAFEYMPKVYFEALQERFPETRPPFESPADHGVFLEVGMEREDDVAVDATGEMQGVARLEALLMDCMEEGGVLDAVICKSDAQRQEMWQRRERAYEATVARGPSVDSDISLALDKVDVFLKRMEERLPAISPTARSLVVAHLGDGNLHYSVWTNPGSGEKIEPELYTQIMELIEQTVLELRGSFSAEHGIGVTKLPSMARRKDTNALSAMRAIKAALDPNGIMNPGKVLPPV